MSCIVRCPNRKSNEAERGEKFVFDEIAIKSMLSYNHSFHTVHGYESAKEKSDERASTCNSSSYLHNSRNYSKLETGIDLNLKTLLKNFILHNILKFSEL